MRRIKGYTEFINEALIGSKKYYRPTIIIDALLGTDLTYRYNLGPLASREGDTFYDEIDVLRDFSILDTFNKNLLSPFYNYTEDQLKRVIIGVLSFYIVDDIQEFIEVGGLDERDSDYLKDFNEFQKYMRSHTNYEGGYVPSKKSLAKIMDAIYSHQAGKKEHLDYHIKNNIPLLESIFRTGSTSHIELITEARRLYDNNEILLSPEEEELFKTSDLGKLRIYEGQLVPLDMPLQEEELEPLDEAEYHGREVQLNKPKRGGSKKFYVYVKNPKTGKIVKVQFGDTTGKKVKISNPVARKSFSARHQCHLKKDKTKPGYWACRMTKFPWLDSGNKT